MERQEQFLEVIPRHVAQQRFHQAVDLDPLGEEEVPLEAALGRVLSRDVEAPVDVPSFDRSNFDGFAVRAEDTFGAAEHQPKRLKLTGEVITPGLRPRHVVRPGQASSIATGGMMPRGADAVVMVEHTEVEQGHLLVFRPVAAGAGVSFAGTDIGRGEVILRRGQELTSRETGVLAAVGLRHVWVQRRVRVAIISTGDELIQPGEPMQPALVYDSNARILADAVRELGAEPVPLGVVRDDEQQLRRVLAQALEETDVVVLSGGTSKGAGDLCYRVVEQMVRPGIVAHGVALKPGKPICLAAHGRKPVVILPGFPTSAVFTFHEFVAPVIARLGGRALDPRSTVPAHMAVKVNSVVGRTEYVLVSLFRDDAGRWVAWPMGAGSGSVTTFSRADGFVTIDRHQELLDAGEAVEVQLLGQHLRLADLVTIGSHCVGLDLLLSRLQQQGVQTKSLWVGSTAGLRAARAGQCDLAGVHLLDPESGQYNAPFIQEQDELVLVPGYTRVQGVVFRPGDARFVGTSAQEVIRRVLQRDDVVMVNRNQGSGTRVLIDQLLQGARPPGYAVQPKSHNAVVAAVAQGRADWGVAIEHVAQAAGLQFLPLQEEHYDFLIPRRRLRRPAVQQFLKLLEDPQVVEQLARRGLRVKPRSEDAHPGD